jgi:bifunctional DNA-binding transcriptional regulator/antitoxin component of YhaV-PrlF toxin-antitoxin module
MAMRKLEDKSIRKLTRAGKTSLSVTIPVEIVKGLGWREKQKVVVKKIRGGVAVRDYKSKK